MSGSGQPLPSGFGGHGNAQSSPGFSASSSAQQAAASAPTAAVVGEEPRSAIASSAAASSSRAFQNTPTIAGAATATALLVQQGMKSSEGALAPVRACIVPNAALQHCPTVHLLRTEPDTSEIVWFTSG